MRSTIILLPLAVLLSCTTIAFSKSQQGNDSSIVSSLVNKTVMLQLINDVRKKGCKCGDIYYYPVDTIRWNYKLQQAAVLHSNDMYRNNYFSHTAPDGSNGGVRLERAGYLWKTYGENIAAGYKNEKDVVANWLSSTAHCKNIMNRNFKEMGVGRAGNYWTQDFGAK